MDQKMMIKMIQNGENHQWKRVIFMPLLPFKLPHCPSQPVGAPKRWLVPRAWTAAGWSRCYEANDQTIWQHSGRGSGFKAWNRNRPKIVQTAKNSKKSTWQQQQVIHFSRCRSKVSLTTDRFCDGRVQVPFAVSAIHVVALQQESSSRAMSELFTTEVLCKGQGSGHLIVQNAMRSCSWHTASSQNLARSACCATGWLVLRRNIISKSNTEQKVSWWRQVIWKTAGTTINLVCPWHAFQNGSEHQRRYLWPIPNTNTGKLWDSISHLRRSQHLYMDHFSLTNGSTSHVPGSKASKDQPLTLENCQSLRRFPCAGPFPQVSTIHAWSE
jgi:hypothetical protein